MRCRIQRVPEEKQPIQIAVCNESTNLLIAAQRAAFKPVYFKAGIVLNQGPCCAGRNNAKRAQGVNVLFYPLEQFGFFVVVSNQRNGTARHSNSFLYCMIIRFLYHLSAGNETVTLH